MSAPGPRSLNCPSCGAGQSVFGGGRVKTYVCSYCGAALDARDGFRQIAERRDLNWPATPLEIGRSGRIDGVEMTVIGVLGVVERYKGREWRWVDHQLYSPTHGYAWLTWEEGRFVFTRKLRRRPDGGGVSRHAISVAESPPIARFGDERYVYYESGDHEISFAAGAFNFTPTVGDTSYVVSLLGRDRMVSRVESDNEVEWEISELAPRDETLRSFGVAPETVTASRRGVHPLESYSRAPIWGEMRFGAFALAGFCLLLMIVFGWSGGGVELGAASWTARERGVELAFTATDADRLLEFELEADVSNAWAELELEIVDAEDETVFAVARLVEFYFGRSGGEAWTEGSTVERLYARLPAPGDYVAHLELGESEVWVRSGRPASSMRLTIRQGHGSAWPAFYVGLIALFAGLALSVGPFVHGMLRRAGSDWSSS